MKKLRFTTLLAATFLAPSALFAQAAPQSPVAAPTVSARPAIWVVKDDDTTIYLFGTVHLLRPNIRWFKDEVKSAFDASPEIVLELIDGDDPASQQKMLTRAMDPKGVPITKRLAPKDAEAYIAMMKDIGIPYRGFEQFKPWFVSIALSLLPMQKAGYDPNSGVEKTLTAEAKKGGKTLIGLETADQQLGYFDSMSEKQQIDMLNSAVKEAPESGKTIDAMVDAWVKGDPARLAKNLNKGMASTPELTKLLLSDRNERWATWIDNRMDTPGTVFIAVGAGHLAGKGSVQDFLKRHKRKATRIKAK
jgi:uncharacterized protein